MRFLITCALALAACGGSVVVDPGSEPKPEPTCHGSQVDGGVTCDPTCDDGVVNQDETDVDCGGLICDPCLPGKHCLVPEDCVKGPCTTGICATTEPPP